MQPTRDPVTWWETRKCENYRTEDAHEAEEAEVDEEGPVGEAVGEDEGGKSSCCDPSQREVEWLSDTKVNLHWIFTQA